MDYNDIPKELMEQVPVEEALKLLGFFEESESGNPKRFWGPIEVIAGPWIPDWILMITIPSTPRSIYLPQERKIGYIMRPIDILVIIWHTCEPFFEEIGKELPQDLMWGRLYYERYTKKQKEELDRRPHLWAEKDFFRFCINYLEKRNDWSKEDYKVEFSYSDRQLKLKAKEDIVFCPAVGSFAGTLTFSARQLFRWIPKRFLKSTVFIDVLDDQRAIIASHLIPACWVENPGPQDKLALYEEEVAP